MKKVLISLLTGVILIGSTPVQAQDKVYGDIYTKEYVYDFYGNVITNKPLYLLLPKLVINKHCTFSPFNICIPFALVIFLVVIPYILSPH